VNNYWQWTTLSSSCSCFSASDSSTGEKISSEIHKLTNSLRNEKELPVKWKETIIVPVRKKCDKIDCSYFRGMSLLSVPYKMLFNILLWTLSPYTCIGQITGDYHCIFRRSESTNNCNFYCVKYWRKLFEDNKRVHQLFVDFKKVYYSVRRGVYTIFS
jgi:hypothetical protein